jgi:hypothetical protein
MQRSAGDLGCFLRPSTLCESYIELKRFESREKSKDSRPKRPDVHPKADPKSSVPSIRGRLALFTRHLADDREVRFTERLVRATERRIGSWVWRRCRLVATQQNGPKPSNNWPLRLMPVFGQNVRFAGWAIVAGTLHVP